MTHDQVPEAPPDFDEFYCKEESTLRAFLIRLGAAPAEAEDASHNAFVEAFAKWGSIRHHRAWLRRVAEREFLKSPVFVQQKLARREAERYGGPQDVPAADHELQLGEQERWVVSLLGMLPMQQRRVMAWHYDGITEVEIAAELNMPENTVRSHLRHARRTMEKIDDVRVHPGARTKSIVTKGDGSRE